MSESERIDVGYAALAVDSGDTPTQDSTLVHGVALGEGDVTRGGSGKETLWPRETLQEAAEGLQGQPLATDMNHTADGAKPQTPVEAVVGEVTWSGYKPGVGVLYEAEVDDEDIANKIQNGRLEVSPLVFRELEPLASNEADFKATDIQKWRDLSLVVDGAAPSNEIQVGSNPMQAEALHGAIESLKHTDNESMASPQESHTEDEVQNAEALKEVGGVEFEGTATGKLDESELPNDDYESHYLYPADTKSDSSYPVVDAEGNLRRGNVDAAWGLGARGGVDADELDNRLMSLAQEFDNPPEWASDDGEAESMGVGVSNPAHWEACSVAIPQSDDGTNGSMSQSSVADDSTEETMTDTELTETEEAVLKAAEDIDEPVEALNEYAATDGPTIVAQGEYEALNSRVETLADMMASRLVEDTGLQESTVDAMSFEAMAKEFETEDGDFDAEALVQHPETGQPEEDDAEALSEDADMEKAEALYGDYQMMSNPPKGLEDDITEALGVEDFDAATEVLN